MSASVVTAIEIAIVLSVLLYYALFLSKGDCSSQPFVQLFAMVFPLAVEEESKCHAVSSIVLLWIHLTSLTSSEMG